MKIIPKTTNPLAKGLRTTEGILVVVANVALVVIPIVTTALPPELAAKLAAGLDAVYAISRAIIKAFATPTPAPAPAPSIYVNPGTAGAASTANWQVTTSETNSAVWLDRRTPGTPEYEQMRRENA